MNSVLHAQSNNFKYYYFDGGNRLVESHSQFCSFTQYQYDKDGNRIKKVVKVVTPVVSVNWTSCGLNNGWLEVFTPPGENYSYKWSTGSTNTKIENLAPGKYQLTIIDLNNSNNYSCTREYEILPSTNPILEAKITPLGSVSFCQGDTLKLKASYQLFNEYIWYRNGSLVQNGFDSIYKATQSGNYWVEIFNSGCSKVSAPIALNTLSKPTPIVVPARNPIICQNDTITLTSSIVGSSYKWNTNQTTKNIVVSQAGFYKLTITDGNGCTGISPDLEVKINQLPQFVINPEFSPPVFCEPDSMALTSSINGIKYLWNNNKTTKSIYVKTSGKYILTLTDNNQCSNTASIDITANKRPPVKANSTKVEICHGEEITLFGTGANMYFWDSGFPDNTPFKPNFSRRYKVTGFDNNNCMDTASIFIKVNLLPEITSTALNIKCYGTNDGEIHLMGRNGTPPYQYSINGIDYFNTPDFLGLATGNYIVSVKDSKGCVSQNTSAQILQIVTELKANISQTDVKCNGDQSGQFTIQTSGGTFPYFYSINNGSFTQNNSYFNLKAGTYNIQVKDNNGCLLNRTINIQQPPILETPTIKYLFVKCFGGNDGSILVEGNGGTPPYRYSLDGGILTSNNNFKNLKAKQYIIKVVDANDCSIESFAIVNEPSKLNASIESQTPDDCFILGTGSVRITASGGQGILRYSIDNGFNFQMSNTFINLVKGNYTIITSDENNCLNNLPVEIFQTLPINNLIINLQNGKLISPYSDPNKWYELGNPNLLGVGKEYTCTHGSVYYVIGTDINGCEARSENLVHNCITSTEDVRVPLKVNVYPNPSSSSFIIEFNDAISDNYTFTLNTEDGKEVIKEQLYVGVQNFIYKLDVKAFQNGNYFLKIENKNSVFKGILIKN